MKKMSKKVVFFGNERLATGVTSDLPVLKALTQAGYDIAAIVTSQRPAGNSRIVRDLEVAEYAKDKQTTYFTSLDRQQIADLAANSKVEVGILVAFGQIVPAEVIELLPKGIINVHPSLLPHYRGASPIEQTILDGAEVTGLSLMQLVPEMDAGPLWAQTVLQLSGQESKQELADELGQVGGDLLVAALPAILKGHTKPWPQDGKATYTKRLRKSDGQIGWGVPAEVIERKVRAYSGFPKATVQVAGHQVVILKARVAKNASDGALVLPAKSGYLEIQQLIAPSGRTMSGADFKRGYQI